MSIEEKIIDVKYALEKSVKALKNNGVIALPTDTIYGFAALLSSETAIKRIYKVKGRASSKPLAIAVENIEDVFLYSKPTISKDSLSSSIIFPGPYTILFEKSEVVPIYLNQGLKNIAIRIPNSPFITNLLAILKEPVVLTSANLSNEPSSLEIRDFESLWPKLDLIIDGGVLHNDKCGSTIVDLTNKGFFSIVRKGDGFGEIKQYLTERLFLEEIKN